MKSLSQFKGRRIRVVLVEDDDLFRAEMERWLRQADDFEILGSYRDGETALPNILQEKPDVVVLDFGLPGIKGDECTVWIKQRLPNVGVLIVTGLPDNAILFEALEAGADGFLDKPLKREAFLAQLEEVLAGGCPLSVRASKLLVENYRKYRPSAYEMFPLTAREREIAELACQGLNDEAIAKKLGIAIWTVRSHQKNIHHKLHIHCRAELQIKLFGLDRTPPDSLGHD